TNMTPFLSGTTWVLAPAASISCSHPAMSWHASQSPWLERAAVVVMPWPLHAPPDAAAAFSPQVDPDEALLAPWLHVPPMEAAANEAPFEAWHEAATEAALADILALQAAVLMFALHAAALMWAHGAPADTAAADVWV